MAELNTQRNLASTDEIYAMLIDLHRDCSEEDSRLRNAKLILALVNHIGDREVIEQAVRIARGD